MESMRYADFRARGLPIGTGVVESAIRRIVNLRLKGPAPRPPRGPTWAV